MGTGSRTSRRLTVRECKIRASLLLKGLLSEDASRALQAAARLCALPDFARLSPSELLARRDTVQRKHALATIAREQGHASWAALKEALEAAAPRFDPERLFVRPAAGFLNRWFASVDEARASLRAEGGWLFPFRDQFFVCERGFLAAAGVDVSDPDWARIGFDWTAPLDEAARARLEQKLIALGFAG